MSKMETAEAHNAPLTGKIEPAVRNPFKITILGKNMSTARIRCETCLLTYEIALHGQKLHSDTVIKVCPFCKGDMLTREE